MNEMFPLPETSIPSEFRSSTILFWWKCCEAFVWKNLELRSPEIIQCSLLRCCDIFSSRRRRSTIFNFSLRNRSTLLPWAASYFSHFQHLLFFNNLSSHMAKRVLTPLQEVLLTSLQFRNNNFHGRAPNKSIPQPQWSFFWHGVSLKLYLIIFFFIWTFKYLLKLIKGELLM